MDIDQDEVLVDANETLMEDAGGEDSDDDMVDEGQKQEVARETRVVRIPQHRLAPLRQNWAEVITPLVEHMKLQVRMNPKKKQVEMRTSEHTESHSALQKGADFVQAFALGFSVQDAMALLRLDDIYIESFLVDDVKMLHGDHLSRAIGRIAGKDGKTKFAIENATRTRIILQDKHVHIMGSYGNIRLARDAVCALILGTPPGKVYAKLRTVSSRVNERF